jgi:hypothetical protein
MFVISIRRSAATRRKLGNGAEPDLLRKTGVHIQVRRASCLLQEFIFRCYGPPAYNRRSYSGAKGLLLATGVHIQMLRASCLIQEFIFKCYGSPAYNRSSYSSTKGLLLATGVQFQALMASCLYRILNSGVIGF